MEQDEIFQLLNARSTEDQQSVTRQLEHARQYACRRGWTVGDGCIFVDDGISGAEFANRPGFLRLMNALKPRPSFQVLVMSEESRLGREAIETAYALKQLVQAGVRVFFYLEDRERTLGSPTNKIMLSLTACADELEREKARNGRTTPCSARRATATSPEGACLGMTTWTHLFIKASGAPAAFGGPQTWLFEYDVGRRRQTARVQVDPTVLPQECPETR